MQREYIKKYSTVLKRDMEMLRHGFYGKPLIMLGTSKSKFYDIENNGVLDILENRINAGEFQIFSLQSTDEEHLYSSNFISKIKKYDLLLDFYEYITKEVFSFIRDEIKSHEKKTIIGFSLGGFHALNIGLRYSEDVAKVITLGGAAAVGNYIHDPISTIKTCYENNISILPTLKEIKFILTCGNKDFLLSQNAEIYNTLKKFGCDSNLITIDGAHDWQTWKTLLTTVL